MNWTWETLTKSFLSLRLPCEWRITTQLYECVLFFWLSIYWFRQTYAKYVVTLQTTHCFPFNVTHCKFWIGSVCQNVLFCQLNHIHDEINSIHKIKSADGKLANIFRQIEVFTRMQHSVCQVFNWFNTIALYR